MNFDYYMTQFPAPIRFFFDLNYHYNRLWKVSAALENQFEPCQEETMSIMKSDLDEKCKNNYSQGVLDQLAKNGKIASRIICLKKVLIDASC